MCIRAINSALSQTLPPTEIIVVEDGSNSGIGEWIEELNDDTVRYVQQPVNRGLPAARNLGVEHASGDLIAFLDDDDIWESEKIERQLALLDQAGNSKTIVYCGAVVVHDSGMTIGLTYPRLKGSLREQIFNHGLSSIPSTVLMRREEALQLGKFDESLASHVDHDMWLTFAANYFRAFAVNEPLVKVFEHSAPKMTTDLATRIRALEEFLTKWEPELIEWYGEAWYRDFKRGHFLRVFRVQLAEQLRKRRLRKVAATISALSKRYPEPSVIREALFGSIRYAASRNSHVLRLKRLLR
jgi:glycosyltransferase involved in cell wall biosynthesis